MTRVHFFLHLLLAALLVTPAGAAPVGEAMAEAEQAFRSRRYAEALPLYEAAASHARAEGDRSKETEEKLEAAAFKSRIHRRATRAKPLTDRQKKANTTRSKVRARVEHVFGHQENSMGGKTVRTVGLVRAKAKIGMMNLVYNMSRLMQLERMAAAPT